MSVRIGIIGDTHGHLHPAIPAAFKGVDRIIHAGDVGGMEVLDALRAMAPVTVVRGNYDREPELQPLLLPEYSPIEIGGLQALLSHNLITMEWGLYKELLAEMVCVKFPAARLAIFGHIHFPVNEYVRGVLFINPGYAGADRREGPATAALLEIDGISLRSEIIKLDEIGQ